MKTLANPTVFLVRHGKTVLNETPKTFRGFMNPPLEESGVRQAHEAGEKLKDYPIHHIYTSPLKRASRTADIISKHTGAEVTKTSALDPWDYGVFTGQEITPKRLASLRRFQENPQKAPAKGESYETFYARFAKGVKAARDFVMANPEKALVLTTHSRNLYPLRHILGEDVPIPVHETPDGKSGGMPGAESPGSVWKLEFDKSEKGFTLERV